ncbi:uncharacterized protein VP01_970g1 [Puccinia sorghi]|uniref:25S rRNA (uridine-N(3))-methyltransferase BMT5-like domain-containing protein n=1 Tax=Puccinia sorghi TaxID=27349 RepID=A0A0L6U5Y3_9BASI|nr:uncharacterized protein VP01_970g1 [Puccinia sorghi]
MAKKKSNLSRALLNAQEQQQRAQKLKQKNNSRQTTSRAHQGTKKHACGHRNTHHQTISNPITREATISSNVLQRNEMRSSEHQVNLDHEATISTEVEIGPPHSRKENEQSAQTYSADPPNKSHTKPRISMVNKNDQVLLVGEGNFSFTVSLLVEHSHPGNLITASTIDTKQTVLKKYPDAEGILKFLEEKKVTILFELDGCKLNEDKRMKKSKIKFDKVIFNFPHVGGSEPDQDRNVRANQILILRFLRSASTLLFQSPDGCILDQARRKKRARSSAKNAKKQRRYSHSSDSEGDRDGLESGPESDAELDLHVRKPGTVLITAGTCPPYSLWDVPALAKNGNILAHTILYPIHPSLRQKGEQPTYKLIRSFNFEKSIVNSHGALTYQHRQTNGFKNSQKDTRPVNPRTWEFQLLCPSSPLSQSC